MRGSSPEAPQKPGRTQAVSTPLRPSTPGRHQAELVYLVLFCLHKCKGTVPRAYAHCYHRKGYIYSWENYYIQSPKFNYSSVHILYSHNLHYNQTSKLEPFSRRKVFLLYYFVAK